MKLLEVDETETQLVIKVHGSNVARVVDKADAAQMREQLLEILAEAPEQKPTEPEVKEEQDEPKVEDEIVDAVETVVEVGRQLRQTEAGQKLLGFLERLPKSKRHKNAG